ncbi:MAG: transglycosylase SLT domain-containing protein, partial [Myxococcaceae bacterium]
LLMLRPCHVLLAACCWSALASAELVPASPARPITRANGDFGEESLAPYFAEGKLKQGKLELDRGQYTKVRATLAAVEQTLPVRYVRALAAFRGGQSAAAAQEMSTLADEYLPMRSYCLWYAAAGYELVGKLEEGIAALELIPEEAVSYNDSRLVLARLYTKTRQWAKAEAVLSPLGNDERALNAAVKLAVARKDVNGEKNALLKIWSIYPHSSLARDADRRFKKKIPVEHQVARAESLVELHLNKQGMALVKPLLDKYPPKNDLGCRAHFVYGKALRKERQHAKAIEYLTPVVAQCKSDALRPRAMYVLGYSQSVVDEARGVLTYEQLAADYPEHPFADDALFLAAELRLELGDEDAALSRYQKVASHHWTGDYAAEARFKTFWIYWRRNQHNEGINSLDEILALTGVAVTDEQVQRAQYWRARALAAMGNKAGAVSALAELILSARQGYYVLLARTRLTELDRAKSDEVERKRQFAASASIWPLKIGALAADSHFGSGIELIRLGMNGAAAELLAVPREDHSADANLALFQILYASGFDQPARVIASAGLVDSAIAERRSLLEVNYPPRFRPLVEKHGRDAKVDPDLLQALIREESRFNRMARSSTGAIGLTQLMPATAKSVARMLKIRRFHQSSLFDPMQNIRIGSAYLGQLLSRWEGNKAFAVASYNAGPSAVRRWITASPDSAMDEWVEEIPVSETRKYVKRVLGSYDAYNLLSKQTPTVEVSAGGSR